ncbi:MAG: type II toxin-antitoxin system HicB family antitoxin [Deltaproteobacteria bacterium]|nr:MAG: type II toxin-antitoxin system HicB family antitoxin [Deltaproteobacteria bacterium]
MVRVEAGLPTYDVLLTKDETGWWVATAPALPGCVSQGTSKAEAKRNIREAIALHVEVVQDDEVVPVKGASLERVRAR